MSGAANAQATDAGQVSALVLGAAGFIGGVVLRRLSAHPRFGRIDIAGNNVYDMSDARIGAAIQGPVNISGLRKLDAPDVVFWSIGGASVGTSIQDPDSDYTRSIPPLSDLLDLLQGSWNQTRLVFISSAAVYGRAGSRHTQTTTPLHPISPYGEHKKQSEEMIRRRLPVGRYVIVRPFSVYGEGLRRQLFWDALSKVVRGETRFHGSGEEMRDWLYIDDLARLLADIGLQPERFSSILNAGTGNGVRVSEALQHLFSCMSIAQPPEFLGVARIGDPDRLVACVEEQAYIASYFQTPLSEGLRRYVHWWRSTQVCEY